MMTVWKDRQDKTHEFRNCIGELNMTIGDKVISIKTYTFLTNYRVEDCILKGETSEIVRITKDGEYVLKLNSIGTLGFEYIHLSYYNLNNHFRKIAD